MLDRKQTKKLSGLIALSLVLILILAACSGNAPANTVMENNNSENTANNMAENSHDSTTPSEAENTTTENAPAEENNSGDTASAEDVSAAATVSFSGDVLPILESRCANCHGGERTEGGLVVLSYADLMAGGESGPAVIPGDAAGSLLVELIVSGEMPKRGPAVTPADLSVIQTWIAEGALDN